MGDILQGIIKCFLQSCELNFFCCHGIMLICTLGPVYNSGKVGLQNPRYNMKI